MSSSAATVVQAADMRAPSGAAAPKSAQRLSATGATGDANATALVVGEMATLLVGATAVRIAFASTEAAAETAVSTTSPALAGYGRFDWMVSASDLHVAIEAADGAATVEAWVWTSSGPR